MASSSALYFWVDFYVVIARLTLSVLIRMAILPYLNRRFYLYRRSKIVVHR